MEKVIEVRGYTQAERDMIEEYLNNNEVKQCPDAMPKKEYKQKGLSSSIITTVSGPSNIFWDEMARQRDVAEAKRLLEKEITLEAFLKNVKGE